MSQTMLITYTQNICRQNGHIWISTVHIPPILSIFRVKVVFHEQFERATLVAFGRRTMVIRST